MASDLTDPSVVKALSHPLRQRILAILDERVASPRVIADELGESLGVVSYHVGVLRDLGLIKLTGTTPRRGALEHHYRAQPRRSLLPKGWGSLPVTVRRKQARKQLEGLVDAVSRAGQSGSLEAPQSVISVRSMRLDPKGRKELNARLEKFLEQLDSLEAASLERGGNVEAVALSLIAFDDGVA